MFYWFIGLRGFNYLDLDLLRGGGLFFIYLVNEMGLTGGLCFVLRGIQDGHGKPFV